jgi:hypothetical protein
MGLSSLRWEAVPLDLALFLTIQAMTLGSAPENPEMTWTIFKMLKNKAY